MEDRHAREGVLELDDPSFDPPIRNAGPLVARISESGELFVYASAAGLAAAIPVPFIDAAATGLARGAAMRKVAARRGVRLSRDARSILASVSAAGPLQAVPIRLARILLSRAIKQLRPIAMIEDGIATFFAAVLLDHYLAQRDDTAPLERDEAERVRNAMAAAIGAGSVDAFLSMPRGLVATILESARALREPDDEDRNGIERIVDTFLDGIASGPNALFDRMRASFDLALEDAAMESESEREPQPA